MAAAPRWGICATIKAPMEEVLRFVAYHLECGAHRLYLYLDAPDPATEAALKAHPRVRLRVCDASYWRQRGMKRPHKHQVRQAANANHAYGRRVEMDWLAHIDVDEFLWTEGQSIAARLAETPADVDSLRLRPMEALAGGGDLYKAYVPPDADRQAICARLYPRFGAAVKGGFLSHVAGKLFLRTGRQGLTLRLHNVFRGQDQNPNSRVSPDIQLCHRHAVSWEQWRDHYRFRLERGSYRAELPPAQPRNPWARSLHDTLHDLEAQEGEAGLRAFFQEVAEATPALCAALKREGLLRYCPLHLDQTRARHFPKTET